MRKRMATGWLALGLCGCALYAPEPTWRLTSAAEALGGDAPVPPATAEDFASSGAPGERAIPLSLRDAVALALAGNRELRAAGFGPVIAAANVAEALAVYDPEAFAAYEFSFDRDRYGDYFGSRYHRNAYTQTERAGLRQRLPTGADVSLYQEWRQGRESGGGRAVDRASDTATVFEITQPILLNRGDRENRDTIRVARLRAEQSDEEFRRAAMDALAAAAEAYWQLAQARENLRIGRENLALAREVLAREESRGESRVATALDVERAREAAASRTVECSRAEEACSIRNERLKLALNVPGARAGSDLGFAPTEALAFAEEAFDEEREFRLALEHRPELKRARLEIKAGEVQYEWARHTRLPSLDLSGRLRGNAMGGSGASFGGDSRDDYGADYTLGLAFSMPLARARSKALQARTLAEWQRSEEEAAHAEDQALAEVRVALRSLALAAAEVPVAEAAVTSAREVIEGERSKFEMNPTGNQDLLRAHDTYAAAERRRVDAYVQYRLARLSLERAKGTLLDHLDVRLEKIPEP